MRTFQCRKCGHALFFDNFECLSCESPLAFLPDRMDMLPVRKVAGSADLWVPVGARGAAAPRYRLCRNYAQHHACNFAVPADDPHPYCVSCRLTRVLPNLSKPENKRRWYRIEVAKRRLFYTLARLGLIAHDAGSQAPTRLVFEFREDMPGARVLTGHADGLITINVSEADDEERTRRRIALHEPYRTLLGHFRHETGHYYWDVLIRDGGRLEECRAVFGDDSADYEQALKAHYASGGSPEGWRERHVSAYATCHPWEDWAETWAHYLHMIDLLETAAGYGTRISLARRKSTLGEDDVTDPFSAAPPDFDELVSQWTYVTLLVNSLNRSLGHDDAYPFALTAGALKKLEYVHDVIRSTRAAAVKTPARRKRKAAPAAVTPA